LKKIIRNSAKCLDCGEEIESTFVHDYRTCKCGQIMVDGGRAYLRRGAKDFSRFEDTSIEEEIA
jgi:hypothetical protein